MTDKDESKSVTLIPGGRRLVIGWTLAMSLLGLFTAVYVSTSMRSNRLASDERHRQRMDPSVRESGVTDDEAELPTDAKPVEVLTGIYVDRISELSVKDAKWTVDFYVWFRWRGDMVSPGKDFHIVDGSVDSTNLDDEFHDGDEHYERYRVAATITKFFDVTRFPLDDHLLTINIEHPSYLRRDMIFVSDNSSSISSRARVSAYRIVGLEAVEKPHAYRTTRGDPRLPANFRGVHSQFRIGLQLVRDGWGFFLKMFQGLFASLAVAMAVFFIKPTDVDPRFGLGVGAFFASIANSYITSGLIPDTGVMTLADIINGLAMVTIFLTMVQSVVSLYVYDIKGDEKLSRQYDYVSFWLFVIGTLGINVLVPFAAAG